VKTATAVVIMLCVMAMVSFSSIASASTITSTPVTHVQPLEKYNYHVTANNTSAIIFINTSAHWLIKVVGSNYTNLTGIPQDTDVGTYYVNITTTDHFGTTYQNFTLDVVPSVPLLNWQTGLAIIFGFGLIAIGAIPDLRFMLFLAGVVWVFAGVGIFMPFGLFFVVLPIGLGLVLMVIGGMSVGQDTD